MLRRERSCQSSLCRPSVHTSVCLTVSVTFRYVLHTGWNISNIISRLSSLRFSLGLTPTWIWAIYSPTWTPEKLGWKGGSWAQKPAISLKWLLWQTKGSGISAFDWYQNHWMTFYGRYTHSCKRCVFRFTEPTRKQESWARPIAKMTTWCALYIGAIFGSPWLRSRLLFPKFWISF